jgi:hypothetical protein
VDPLVPVAAPVRDVPVVPEVDPAELAVEPVALEDPDPAVLAFVRMNDALAPGSEPVRDAVVPAVVDPLVDPVVPVAPLMSPRCRQPVTVIVLPCALLLVGGCELLVCGLLVCAATIAAHPKPIANAAPTRFIDASLFF